jgi:SAM-dependent methyltransferase
MKIPVSIIRCPTCHSDKITNINKNLNCGNCSTVFLIENELPVLFCSKKSQVLYENYLEKKGKNWIDLSLESISFRRKKIKTPFKTLNRILNFIRYPYLATPAPPSFVDLHKKYSEGGHVLSLSGGSTSPDLEGWINMDILDYKTVDTLGDALNLPFNDNVFDFITSNSSLEHIPDYQKVIDECYRVLKPGGVFYLCVPLVCRQHHIHDYHRWTIPGLKLVMKDFIIIDNGVRNGPGTFFPIILEGIIQASALPFFIKELARTIGLWIAFPFRFTDKFAKKKRIS